MMMQDTYDVGIYCRLSRDDNNGSLESMSIANQRQMLSDYVREKGWDTPITGPTFGRALLAVRLRTSGVPDSHAYENTKNVL